MGPRKILAPCKYDIFVSSYRIRIAWVEKGIAKLTLCGASSMVIITLFVSNPTCLNSPRWKAILGANLKYIIP